MVIDEADKALVSLFSLPPSWEQLATMFYERNSIRSDDMIVAPLSDDVGSSQLTLILMIRISIKFIGHTRI